METAEKVGGDTFGLERLEGQIQVNLLLDLVVARARRDLSSC
jgi:hypothetical protein